MSVPDVGCAHRSVNARTADAFTTFDAGVAVASATVLTLVRAAVTSSLQSTWVIALTTASMLRLFSAATQMRPESTP